MLAPLWLSISSLVFFYLSKLLSSGFLKIILCVVWITRNTATERFLNLITVKTPQNTSYVRTNIFMIKSKYVA